MSARWKLERLANEVANGEITIADLLNLASDACAVQADISEGPGADAQWDAWLSLETKCCELRNRAADLAAKDGVTT